MIWRSLQRSRDELNVCVLRRSRFRHVETCNVGEGEQEECDDDELDTGNKPNYLSVFWWWIITFENVRTKIRMENHEDMNMKLATTNILHTGRERKS